MKKLIENSEKNKENKIGFLHKKENQNSRIILCENQRFSMLNYSHIGQGHLAMNTKCQDFGLVGHLSATKNENGIICAADGHGAALHDRSDIGAAIACETIKEIAEKLINNCKNKEAFLAAVNSYIFRKAIIEKWRENVVRHHLSQSKLNTISNQGLRHSVIKRYGTTLIFAFSYDDILVTGQIGDGGAALLGRGGKNCDCINLPLVEKIGSGTTSLCMDNAEDFFIIKTYNLYDFECVVLATDGVYDSFESVDDFFSFAADLRKITQNAEIDTTSEIMEGLFEEIKDCTNDDLTVTVLNIKNEGKTVSESPAYKIDRFLNFRYGSGGAIAYYKDKTVYVNRGSAKNEVFDVPPVIYKNSKILFSQAKSANIYSEPPPKGFVTLNEVRVFGRPDIHRFLKISDNFTKLILLAGGAGFEMTYLQPHNVFLGSNGEVYIYAEDNFSLSKPDKNKYNELSGIDYSIPTGYKGDYKNYFVAAYLFESAFYKSHKIFEDFDAYLKNPQKQFKSKKSLISEYDFFAGKNTPPALTEYFENVFLDKKKYPSLMALSNIIGQLMERG